MVIRIEKRNDRIGWDVSAILTDGKTTSVITFYWPFKEEPAKDDAKLLEKVKYLQENFIEEGKNTQEPSFAKSEVEALLIEKGYLVKEAKLEDLKTAAEFISEKVVE